MSLTYRQKLAQFNNTAKYELELEFMFRFMDFNRNQKILDYGAGTGYMANELNGRNDAEVYGYDVKDYLQIPDKFRFRDSFHFKFDKVYFMHSLAHIEGADITLQYLKENFLKDEGMIYVFTPNLDWLKNSPDQKGYVSDSTVVEHFDLDTLTKLLEKQCKIIEVGQYGNFYNGHNERIFMSAK